MNPIVGIGELLWDIYPDGRKVAGGAPFNFAFHCHQLGHDGVIVSRVGDDDLGRELRDEVKRLGLSDEYIQTDHEHPTGTVQVKLDAAGVPTYSITENVAWDYIEFGSQLAFLTEFALALCFGTLAQRNKTSADTIYSFVTAATGAFRVFDVNIRNPRVQAEHFWVLLSRSTWVKFNETEFASLLQSLGIAPHFGNVGEFRDQTANESKPLVVNSDSPFRLFARRCLGIPQGKVILCTRGENGCELFKDEVNEPLIVEPAVPARVIDTVGAGDAFTAAMVCLHLEGRPLHECARFASHYAARVCERAGATPRIDRRDVERAAFGK